MAKPKRILDVLVEPNASKICDAVNGLHEDEPGGIAKEDIQSIEHDGTHGRWAIFYWRDETGGEAENREKCLKNKKPQ
jgi:hypothetical protein